MREETAGGEKNGRQGKETAGREKTAGRGKKRQAGKTAAGEKTAVLMRESRNKRLEKYHIL